MIRLTVIEIPWGLIALAIVLEVVVLAATGKAKMDLSMGVVAGAGASVPAIFAIGAAVLRVGVVPMSMREGDIDIGAIAVVGR